jgi:hypothetical protein
MGGSGPRPEGPPATPVAGGPHLSLACKVRQGRPHRPCDSQECDCGCTGPCGCECHSVALSPAQRLAIALDGTTAAARARRGPAG